MLQLTWPLFRWYHQYLPGTPPTTNNNMPGAWLPETDLDPARQDKLFLTRRSPFVSVMHKSN